jgi:hypothetical protein
MKQVDESEVDMVVDSEIVAYYKKYINSEYITDNTDGRLVNHESLII